MSGFDLLMSQVDRDDMKKDIFLYMGDYCPYSQRIAFALLEKKLPFEVVKIPWRLPRPDWYLGVNPKGALPYLRYKNEFYDDWQKIFVLLDSWEPKLTGVDTNRWLAQAESDFAAAWREYLTNGDKAKDATLKANMDKECKRLNDGLEKSAYLEGSRLSYSDITFWTWLDRFSALKTYKQYDIPKEMTKLLIWLEVVNARPAAQRVKFNAEKFVRWFMNKPAPQASSISSLAGGKERYLFESLHSALADKVRKRLLKKEVRSVTADDESKVTEANQITKLLHAAQRQLLQDAAGHHNEQSAMKIVNGIQWIRFERKRIKRLRNEFVAQCNEYYRLIKRMSRAEHNLSRALKRLTEVLKGGNADPISATDLQTWQDAVGEHDKDEKQLHLIEQQRIITASQLSQECFAAEKLLESGSYAQHIHMLEQQLLELNERSVPSARIVAASSPISSMPSNTPPVSQASVATILVSEGDQIFDSQIKAQPTKIPDILNAVVDYLQSYVNEAEMLSELESPRHPQYDSKVEKLVEAYSKAPTSFRVENWRLGVDVLKYFLESKAGFLLSWSAEMNAVVASPQPSRALKVIALVKTLTPEARGIIMKLVPFANKVAAANGPQGTSRCATFLAKYML